MRAGCINASVATTEGSTFFKLSRVGELRGFGAGLLDADGFFDAVLSVLVEVSISFKIFRLKWAMMPATRASPVT